MSKCEICGGKEGGPVKLPAGDLVPRQLLKCPQCKTILCNSCVRAATEEVSQKKRAFNLFKTLAEMWRGGAPVIVQYQCSICNSILDFEANRFEVGPVAT